MVQQSPRIAILAALPVEYKAVRDHLVDLQEIVHPQGTIYERGRFPTKAGALDVVICEIGAGNEAAAIETERVVQHFQPEIVFFVGVAGGIKDVELHDVVVGTRVYGYESGKAKTRFLPRPDVFNSAYGLVQRARAESRKDNWLQRIRGEIPTSARTPNVLVGPIAAGEKVIASTRASVMKFIKAEYSDALAVEMEGHGFLKAVHASQNVQALLVRGISDLIKGKKASDDLIHQKIAAQNASAFAFEILERINLQDEAPKKRRRLKPAKQIVYELNLPLDEQQRIQALHGWRFLELPLPQQITVTDEVVRTGTRGSTTFHRAPGADILNCSVECELRIIDDGDDRSRWAGIRVRGFHDDIRFGYLIYLRSVGTVELYRAGKILRGDNQPKVNDTRNQWTHLRVAVLKNRIKVWVNDALHINAKDTMFKEKGGIYIHTFGTSAEFKNFKIHKLTRWN